MRIIHANKDSLTYEKLNYSDFLTTNEFEYEKAEFIGNINRIDTFESNEGMVSQYVLPSYSTSIRWRKMYHNINFFNSDKTARQLIKDNCKRNIYRRNRHNKINYIDLRKDILKFYNIFEESPYNKMYNHNSVLIQYLTKKKYKDAELYLRKIINSKSNFFYKYYLKYLLATYWVKLGIRDGCTLDPQGNTYYNSPIRKLIPVIATVIYKDPYKVEKLHSHVYIKDSWEFPKNYYSNNIILRDAVKKYPNKDFKIYDITLLDKNTTIKEILIKQHLEALPMKSIKEKVRLVESQLEQNNLDTSLNWDILLEYNKEKAVRELIKNSKYERKTAKSYVDIIWGIFFNGRKPDTRQKNKRLKVRNITILCTDKEGKTYTKTYQTNGLRNTTTVKKKEIVKYHKPRKKIKPKKVRVKYNRVPDKMVCMKFLNEEGLIDKVEKVWRTDVPGYIEAGWSYTSKGTFKSFTKLVTSNPGKPTCIPGHYTISDDPKNKHFGKLIFIEDDSKNQSKKLKKALQLAAQIEASNKNKNESKTTES